MYRKYAYYLVAAIIISVLAGTAVNYFRSFSVVTFSLDPIQQAELFTNNNTEKPVATIADGQKTRLRQGNYVAVLVGETAKDYSTNKITFGVEKGQDIVSIKPAYSDTKLTSLLVTERTQIQQVIAAEIPTIYQKYTPLSGRLFEKGEWYAEVLKANDPALDNLRVALHKIDGKWVLLTRTPQIIISGPLYPEIPRTVVSSMNTL